MNKRRYVMVPADFEERVYTVVRQIPRGKVTTYGQIAYMIGFPKNARLVGATLKHSKRDQITPCHRVVNANRSACSGLGRTTRTPFIRRCDV